MMEKKIVKIIFIGNLVTDMGTQMPELGLPAAKVAEWKGSMTEYVQWVIEELESQKEAHERNQGRQNNSHRVSQAD